MKKRDKSNHDKDISAQLPVENHNIPSSTKKEKIESARANVAIIFHASISSSALLGGYDQAGRWMDGLLVRSLRRFVDRDHSEEERRSSSLKGLSHLETIESKYFIILDGPMNLFIEELLHSIYFQTPRVVVSAAVAGFNVQQRGIMLPTNELLVVPPSTKILVETDDISQASPNCLSLIPLMNFSATSAECINRIITVWTRSVTHWLGDFAPWLDFMDEMNKLLLETNFVEDMLYEHLSSGETPALALLNSQLGSFLRLLEELLLQVQESVLPFASFVATDRESASDSDEENDTKALPNDKHSSLWAESTEIDKGESRSSMGVEWRPSLSKSIKFAGTMSLSPRVREILLRRARLSVVYAAIWGFGGALNSSEKRKFFDSIIRDTVQHYMDPDVVIPSDCLVFELYFDVDNAELVPALEYGKGGRQILQNSCLTAKQLEQNIFCEFIDNSSGPGTLVFRSMSSRAVSSVLRLLVTAGANVLLFGQKGSGKTHLIQGTLEYFRQETPSPSDLRRQIIEKLLDILCGATVPQGIFRALEIIRTILFKSANIQLREKDDQNDFNTLWRAINSDLETFAHGSARANCVARAVSSASTSLCVHESVRGVRSWLEREFATEVNGILETARFSYGVAFIDDVHVLSLRSECINDPGRSSLVADRIDELLRGLLYGHPCFGIRANPTVRSPLTLGHHRGSNDGGFLASNQALPLLHRETFTDIRVQQSLRDNYLLQQLGLISAASGQYNDHRNKSWLNHIASHFAMLSLPSLTVAELHVALVSGAFVMMSTVVEDLSLLSLLQSEVSDLSRITLNLGLKTISSVDLQLTTTLERTLRVMILLDIGAVSRFSLSLRYGSVHIKNPGGLLQLYAHEWKRYFLDPLPLGAQRDRLLGLMHEHLDNLDEKVWAVSHDWIKEIKEELSSTNDKLWMNSLIFEPEVTETNGVAQEGDNNRELLAKTWMSLYLPVSLNVAPIKKWLQSGEWCAQSLDYKEIIPANEISSFCNAQTLEINLAGYLSDSEARALLYPSALSLLLRLVRVLSVQKRHLVVAGYPGCSKRSALMLAARICRLEAMVFAAKPSQSVADTRSEIASPAFKFKQSLKAAVLRATGFSDPVRADDIEQGRRPDLGSIPLFPEQVYYSICPSQNIVYVVNEAQQLSEIERRYLLHIVDFVDPTVLFEDAELLGMIDALRREAKSTREREVQVKHEHIQSQQDTGPAATALHANIPNAMSNPSMEALSAARSVDAADLKEGLVENLGENTALVSTGGGATEDISKESFDESTTDVKDESLPVTSQKVVTSSALKSKQGLTGYSFHWIKSHLRSSLQGNFCVILNLSLAAVVEISPAMYYSGQDCSILLRKSVGQSHAKSSNKANGEKAAPIQKLSVSGGIDAKHIGLQSPSPSGSSPGFYQPTMGRRFSMRTARSSDQGMDKPQVLFNPAASLTTVGNRSDAAIDESGVETSNGVNGGSVGGLGGVVGNNSNLGVPLAQSIFTCPILGPILNRKFNLIWYEIGSNEAVNGLATVFMRNKQAIHSGRSLDNVLLLPLRTLPVGSYHTSALSETLPDTNTSRRLTAVEKEAQEKDEQRRVKFTSSSTESRSIHLHLITTNGPNHCSLSCWQHEKISSIVHLFGVFRSFETEYLRSEMANLEAEKALPLFLDEAKVLLPSLLTLSLPSDGLFLKEHAYTESMESISQRAMQTVMWILSYQGRELLKSKCVLEHVLVGLQESCSILEHDEDMNQRLAENNEELAKIVRELSKEVDDTRKNLENLHISFQKSSNYEIELMLKEEISCMSWHIDSFIQNVENQVLQRKNQLRSFSASDWHVLSKSYNGKITPKAYIEMMRALMVVINYSPPKILKGDKSGAGNVKMDDEVVAKCALTLLIKPHDFVNQLCAVQATNLSSAQSNALRVMNSLLNSQFVPYFDTEFCSPEKRFEMQETLAGPNPDEQPTADCLRRFLLSLDLHIVANQCVRERRPHVEVLEMELISLRKANADAQASQSNELKAKLEHLMGKMTSIEGSMLSNRKKIDIMEKNRTRKPVIMKGLTQFRLFIEEEVDHLYKILRNLVGDLCLIVAVLYRSGWLPDSQRQDCADMMRRHMRFHKIACTETPILAGSIFDRLQFRSFCSFSEVSASYDIPSMNCLSLLYLSPAHTLVVDPDNVALTAIIDAAPNGFETYSLPAQRFSLPVFDTWRRNALDNKSRDASIYLVIYDVHAGVSDDLITLLSAELDETYGFDSDNCLEADKMCPRLIINVGCLVGERSLAPHILIPPRFRVVLISNRSAVLDGNGRSSPLPLACLQQLTILHWTCSASPLIVEVNPLNAACEKHTATSNSFAYRLAHKLLAIQAGSGQSLPFKLQALSQQIVLTCRSLLDMEREIIGVVYHWLEGDILSSEKVFHIEGLVDQETVSLSILSSEQVVETLCKAIVRRESLKEEIMRARLLWREGVVYLSCVMNLFSMSADFLRLCGLLLPTADLFAPYSLSPASLATHLLSMFFNNSNGVKALIKKVPSSLLGALKVWNGIVALQRCLRSAKKADKTIPLVTGIREKSVDSPSTDDQQGMRKETERFVLSDQARKVAEEGNRSVGLSPTLRQKASHVLHFLLNPLKQPFLRDLSRYAELTIRPGCEHLVKYLLLVCSWAQDNSTVPLDEVRALTYLLLDSLRIPDRRFVHLLPIKRGIEDTSFSTKRLSSAYLISSGDNLTQRLRRCSTANAGQAPFQHGPASEDLKPNTQDKNDVVTSQEEEEEEEGFPQPLSILKRVTAFRTLAVSAPVLQKPKVEDRGIKWSTGQLLERGYGIPDGLFFNRRCFDWTIVYSCCSHSPHDLICSLVADQIDDVKLCSRLTRGPVTYGDPFEIDWLKLHGIRAFHTNNALALAALGASQRSTEEIAQARRPTVVSVVAQKNKLSSLPKQRKQTLLPKLQNHQRSERNELKREQQEEPTHQLNARRLTTRVSPLLQDMLQQTNNRILLTSRKTPSGKEKMLSKGTISSFHPSTNQVEDIFDVVQNSEAFQRLILIESHSSLAPIFKGLAGQLLRCRADLLSWKERLLDMAQAELSKTRADQVLECLMAGRPPLCFDIEESSSGGAFSRGAELSVLQSMLLAEALWPGSATTLLQLAFLVLRDYLKMGGHLHEYNKEDEDKDFENEHDDDDADDDSDENDMEMNSSSLTTKRTEDQSSEEEEEDDDRFEAPFSLGEQRENLERRGQNLGDLLLAPSNCWAKLERGLCTTTPFFREGIRDWEGVVMEVAAECLEVDKFVFMKELRDSICGSTTTYFLAPIFSGSDNSSQPQLSIFTQRARELALLTGRHLPVVFCDIISADRGSCYSNCLLDSSVVGNVYSGPSSEEAASKLVQQQMVEVIKNLRGSLSTARKALVERLSLSSSAASALFYSSILPSATMTKVMVEGSSVGSSTNVKIGGTSSGSEEGKRWAEGIPFIVSSSWGMNSRGPLGIFPPVALSELSFAWLPRFFAPDVVTLRTSASSSSSNSGLGNWPDISLPESCGILFEELETNLLRWLNASKAIRRTRLTSEIRQRLNRTNKLQTRMLAALVTIYQLHCYLRADALEKRGLRGVWSSCLNQLELWQLSRLTLKLSDLLSAEWMGKDGSLKVTRRDLLGQLTFRRAIKVLVESFSRPGQDFYRMSFTSLVDMGGSTGKRRLLSAMALTTVSGNTGQGISTNEINNRQDNRGWRALMGQLKGGDKESLGLKGQTGSSSRAKKQWKKMMRKVEEGRQQFVRGLSNDLMLRASCASGTLSDSVFAEASVLQVTQEINSEMQRRFIAMVEHFVAEIIAIMSQHRVEAQEEAEAQGQDALPTERRRASSAIEAAAMYIINARKQSTKMNINSIITGTTPSQNVNILSQGNLKIADPEVAFGALPPEDVLQCLVKWTLDGSRSGQGGNERIGGIDRMKILRSIKRLSAFVKQQAQHEPTK